MTKEDWFVVIAKEDYRRAKELTSKEVDNLFLAYAIEKFLLNNCAAFQHALPSEINRTIDTKILEESRGRRRE